MLDLIRTPELAAEVTLQPIEAFGFDAAIIFSDILPPLVGMGLELDFVRGVGPHIANRIERPYDVDVLGTPPCRGDDGGHARGDPHRRARARSERRPRDRVLRRALHPRQLRDRGRRDEGLRAHEGVHALRAGGLAAADEQARDRAGGLPRRPGTRRGLRAPGVRLVGRACARAVRLRPLRAAAQQAPVRGRRAGRRAGDQLQPRRLLVRRGSGRLRRRRDRPRLAPAAAHVVEPHRLRPSRPGEPRSDRAARSLARAEGARRPGAGRRRGPSRAHLQRRPRRAPDHAGRERPQARRVRRRALVAQQVRHDVASISTRAGVLPIGVLDHGLRGPVLAGGDAGLPGRHPLRAADQPRGARRDLPQLRGDRGPLAAARDLPPPGRRRAGSARPGPLPLLSRHAALGAVDRGGRRRDARGRHHARGQRGARAALQRALRSRNTPTRSPRDWICTAARSRSSTSRATTIGPS